MTVTVDDRLAGALDLQTIETIAIRLGARAPMLVGHDPDFSELLASSWSAADGLEMQEGHARDDRRAAGRSGRARGPSAGSCRPSLLNDH